MNRTALARALIAGMLVLAALHPGEAGAVGKKTYISTFTLIMDFTDRAMTWVEKHGEDAQLARAAAAMARANVETVQDLSPPADFVDVHPHFVAIVESSQAAFEAVAASDMPSFQKIKSKIKKERQSLQHVLNEHNFVFPEII